MGGGEIIVTRHAVERYQQRIDPAANDDEAREAILSHAAAISIAASFGAPCVKLGDGSRLKLAGNVVVTCIGPSKRRAA